MQRRVVSLAPLLACALLLHLGFALATAPSDATTTHDRVPATAPTDSVRLEAYRVVTALATRTGQLPEQRTVVVDFHGKVCGSLLRPGRNSPAGDRRDPAAQATFAPPDAPLRRDSTAGGRPLATAAFPEPVRSSVLRC